MRGQSVLIHSEISPSKHDNIFCVIDRAGSLSWRRQFAHANANAKGLTSRGKPRKQAVVPARQDDRYLPTTCVPIHA